MIRILILVLGAMLTLAGCGGGGDGIQFGTPQVTVNNLEGTVTVSVNGDSHLFQGNGTHRFDKIQNNKNYKVSISGNKSCGFTGSHDANNDEPTQVANSKNANERFTIRCSLSSDGTPGGSGDDEDEDDGEPNVPRISLSILGEVGKADSPIADGKNAQVQVKLTENNLPISGALLRARVSPSDVARVSSETIATNESGIAIISLSNGVKRGAAELVVTYVKSGEELAERSIVISSEGGNTEEVVAEGEITIGDIVYADGKEQIEDGHEALVEVTVINSKGGLVQNASILFELDRSNGDIGRLVTETAQTDEFGKASVKIFAGTKPGVGVVKASVFHVDGDASLVGLSKSKAFKTKGDEKLDDESNHRFKIEFVGDDPITIEKKGNTIVQVRVTSIEDSQSIKDALVRFEIEDIGIGRLEPVSAVTNEDGIAEVTLFAGSVNGASKLIAKVDGANNVEKAFSTKGGEVADDENSADVSLEVTIDPEIIKAGKEAIVTVTVTSEDDSYELGGQVIRFATEEGLGTFEGNGLAITDDQGIARILLGSGDKSGGDLVVATFEDINTGKTKTVKKPFRTEGKQTYELVITASRGTSSTTAIEADNPATLVVMLQREGSIATDFNDVVELTTTIGRFDKEQNSVQLLLENGEGSIDLYAGFTAGAGRVTVTAQVSGNESYEASLALVSAGNEERDMVGQQPTLALILVEAGTIDPVMELSQSNQAEVLIKLEPNGADLVLSEQMIRFTTVTGAVLDKETVMLNADGEARVSIVPTDLEGAGTLVAVLEDDSSVSATRHFATKGDGHPGGEEPYPVTIELGIEQDGAEVSEVDNTKPAKIQIALVGGADDITNRLVTVASTVGSVAPTTVLTDGDGKATATLNTKNTWNAGVITTTLQSNEGETLAVKSKSFGIKGKMPGEVSIAIELADNNGNSIGTPQDPITQERPANIKVTVKRGTDEVKGALVRVSSDLGELSPASGTTITNNDGEATSLVLRAGDEAGAGTLTARVMIDGEEYSESIYFLTWGVNNYDPNDPLVLELDLIGKETNEYPNSEHPITDSNPATVTAKLTRGGIAIREALVRFETNLGVIDPGTGTALTDENGMATVMLQIADESGAGTIVATYDRGDVLVVEKHFEMSQTKDGLQLSELVLLDSNGLPGNGVIGKELSETNMAVARVRLLGDSGAPKHNEIIYFSIENTLGGSDHGVLGYPSALTDSQGYAEVTLRAGTKGAARLIATYDWKGVELRRSTPFMSLGGGEASGSIKPALGYRDAAGNFHDGKLQLVDQVSDTGPVSAGSTVAIGVDLVKADDTSAAWPGIVKVELGSICADNGTAQLDDSVTLINGRGIAIYKVVETACKQDQIWAKIVIEDKELNAFTEIFGVEHSPAGFIEFEGSEHEKISLKGASAAGLNETTTLTFLVRNRSGQTVSAGERVNFSAVNALGGFKVNIQSALTNNDGIVEVQVSSGTVPYTATVRAELDGDSSVFAHGKLPVTTGVVTQDRFILSLSDHNPLAWDKHLAEVTVNVSAADRMGNLADGTIVYFTTKLGQIRPECVISDGKCSVTWISGGSQTMFFDENRQGTSCEADSSKAFDQGVIKPEDCVTTGVRWKDRYGRNVITAYTAGEESFRDDGGNNVFDSTARYISLTPEVFRDDNVTGKYEALADEFHVIPGLNTANTGRFHGVGCSEAAIAEGHCETLTHVRRSVLMTLSTNEFVGRVFGSEPNLNTIDWNYDAPIGSMMTGVGTPPSIETEGIPYTDSTIYIAMHDAHGAAPGSGSSVSIDEGGRELITTTCGVVKPTQTEVYICEARFKAMELVDVVDANGDPTGDKALANQDPDFVKITLANDVETKEIVLGVDTAGL